MPGLAFVERMKPGFTPHARLSLVLSHMLGFMNSSFVIRPSMPDGDTLQSAIGKR